MIHNKIVMLSNFLGGWWNTWLPVCDQRYWPISDQDATHDGNYKTLLPYFFLFLLIKIFCVFAPMLFFPLNETCRNSWIFSCAKVAWWISGTLNKMTLFSSSLCVCVCYLIIFFLQKSRKSSEKKPTSQKLLSLMFVQCSF